MSFGLNNIELSYQRVINAISHDISHDCLKEYIDDIVVKPKEVHDRIDDLRESLEGYR